jgi:DNA-binding MarR family transcriptional regulator
LKKSTKQPHPLEQLTDAEYEALAAFRYTLRQFLRFAENAARSVGLTPQKYLALLAIKGFPGEEAITIGELAERLQIKHHSTVELVDRMKAQGLVEREPSQRDRRQVCIVLTDYGAEMLGKTASANRRQLRRLGPELQTLLARLSEDSEARTPND